MSDTTSPTLLARLRDPADASAWRRFDARYGELILRYCMRRGLQHNDAEDVRQLVLVRLAGAMPRFVYDRSQGRFRHFIGRVVHNEILRFLARPSVSATRVIVGDAAPAGADESGLADPAWEREWMLHHLRLAMQQIRASFEPRSVEMFERLLAGDDVGAVARRFGVSAEAVHKIKQRVRNRLKLLVADQIRNEDVHAAGPAE